jgi:hypothetical protein
MFTSRQTPLGKLRAYYRGLGGRYGDALRHRDFARARFVYDLRWRVLRAILVREEWCVG